MTGFLDREVPRRLMKRAPAAYRQGVRLILEVMNRY